MSADLEASELEQLALADARARAELAAQKREEPPPAPFAEVLVGAERGAAELLEALKQQPLPGSLPVRPWWCGKADCRKPGVWRPFAFCAECEAKDRAERWRPQIDRARRLLPGLAQGCALGVAWLDERAGADAVDDARAWVDRPTLALCLEGTSGPGKSALALAVLNELLERGASGESAAAARLAAGVRFVSIPALVAAVAAHGLGKGDAPLVREALGATVLALDDLGAEGADPTKALGRVLQERYLARRPTIVTTGMLKAGVVARYDEGVARRVYGSTVITLRGDWQQDELPLPLLTTDQPNDRGAT